MSSEKSEFFAWMMTLPSPNDDRVTVRPPCTLKAKVIDHGYLEVAGKIQDDPDFPHSGNLKEMWQYAFDNYTARHSHQFDKLVFAWFHS